jgi:hypothetical protein
MKFHRIALITVAVFLFCISCQADTSPYENQPFVSTSGTAQPGEETRIELEDGAAIVIPAGAIESEVSVTIERNPAKVETLPPLGENGVQLGDFYNFEVTEGELVGAVDLVLPLDESRIPEGEGILSIAFPTASGWEFVPVEADGDHVTIYTTHLGDPLMYWHFGNSQERIDWGRVVAGEELSEPLLVCDKHIPLSVTPGSGPVGTEFTVSGHLLPVREIPGWASYAGADLSDLPSPGGVSVEISFGGGYMDQSAKTVKVTTGEDGRFETSFTPSEAGWVYVTAKAQCDAWFGVMPVPSEGRANPIRAYEEEAEAEVVETEAPRKEYKVESGVLLPDFIGQPMDEVIGWLKDKGFGYTWIDGSSAYELGVVYDQNPRGEKNYVPHRTTVVLYRTQFQKSCPRKLIFSGEVENQTNVNCLSPKTIIWEIIMNCDGSISAKVKDGHYNAIELTMTGDYIFSDYQFTQGNQSPEHLVHEANFSGDYQTLTGTSIYWQESGSGSLENPTCLYEFKLTAEGATEE